MFFYKQQIYRFNRCATIELNLRQNGAINESIELLLNIQIILPIIESVNQTYRSENINNNFNTLS